MRGTSAAGGDRVGRRFGVNLSDAEQELLMQFIDRTLAADDEPRLNQLLQHNASARQFLQDMAELAIVVADRARLRAAVGDGGRTPPGTGRPAQSLAERPRRSWIGGLAVVTVCLVLGGALWGAERLWSARQRVLLDNEPCARIQQLGGLVQLLNGRGQFVSPVQPGQPLRAGDLLRTQSSDAWVELQLQPSGPVSESGAPRDAGAASTASLIVSGHSGVKLLAAPQGARSFVLERGSLWIDSPPTSRGEVSVTTMVAEIHASQAVCSLQSSADESIVRVKAGEAWVFERLTSRRLTVRAGEEVTISLLRPEATRVVRQPASVAQWQLRLPEGREASFGTILSHTPGELRIRAAPLLWPLPEREPVLLHVVAIAAWQCSDSPVVLTPGSRLRYRGRLQRPQMVRFGFSTARVQGVFAGKFEIDIPADRLSASGEEWEIEIPLADFHPLPTQAVDSPLGMELTDVYALTITTDAGLELHDIELLPATLLLEQNQ